MKWLWVVATVLVASLLAVGPVLAETMPCDQATVQSLADCVQHAAQMGYITNQGVTQSLLAQTSAAQAAVSSGNNATAINILHAFIYEVQAQAGQQIAADHAAHMIMHAQNVITALGG